MPSSDNIPRLIGTTISHYRITAKLGQGEMGEVYRATDTKLDREVAIKILPPEIAGSPQRRMRFLREAKAASALTHPNVCTICEVGETEEGQPFIAMEYLPGQTLESFVKRKPLEKGAVVDLAIQIADALDAAHQAGIVHRDIKPANIHVDARNRVKVLDFAPAGQLPIDRKPFEFLYPLRFRRFAMAKWGVQLDGAEWMNKTPLPLTIRSYFSKYVRSGTETQRA